MRRFGYFEQTQIDQLIACVDSLVVELNNLKARLKPRGHLTFDEAEEPALRVSVFDDTQPSEKHVAKRFNKEGPTLGDLVYEKVNLENFSAREAFEAISPFVTITSGRPVDSVRAALDRDKKRFEKIGAGRYRKIDTKTLPGFGL